MFDLKDKVVLITGGAGGIGEQVVRLLLEEKVKHVAILDIDETQGISLQNELLSKHGAGRVKWIKCDVTNDDHLMNAFKTTTEEQGYIDVVINNAGTSVESGSMAAYKKEVELNVTAVITSTMKAIELMHKGGGGRGGIVINVASIAALMQVYILPVYCSTKSAVLQFSSCIGDEAYYAKTGVKVMTMCFGTTNTPILGKTIAFNQELHKDFLETLKMQSPQSPLSAAQALIHACKVGDTASVWVSTDDKPAKDLTPVFKQAQALFQPYLSFNRNK